jgi:hypothetical protein
MSARVHTLVVDYAPIGFQALTVDGTAGGVGFTLPTGKVLSDISSIFMTCETAQIRWTIDGTTVTASNGHIMDTGTSLTLSNRDAISKFKAIRVSASGALMVTYLGGGR